MVKSPHWQAPVLGLVIAVAAFAACQSIAGIEDKSLDPSLGRGGTGGTTATGGSSGTGGAGGTGVEAGEDVNVDVTPEAEAGPLGAEPPKRPPGDAAPSGSGITLTYAVRRFFLGTFDPEEDSISLAAWKKFGFDYDGECTTQLQSEQNASHTCVRPGSANAASLEDGEQCRDNTGGHLLAEVLGFVDQNFELKVHNGTRNGVDQTIILQIADVDEGPDDPYAPGRLYISAPKDGGMLWGGNDELAVDVESLIDGGIEEPRWVLPDGYIRDHVWVSGDFKGGPIVVPMMVLNRVAAVPAESATMMVVLDEDHVEAEEAVFAGALDTVALEPLLRVGMLEATECNQSMTNIGMGMFLPNRDLGGVPGFTNPNSECQLLSIAVGLEFKRVKPPTVVVDVPPLPSACDAGPE